MEIFSVSGVNELSSKLGGLNDYLAILYFYVDDSAECNQMSDVITELSKNEEDNVAIIKINASKDDEISKKYNVASVPSFIFLRGGNVVDNLVGANVPAFSKKIEENLKTESIEDRLRKLINKAPVMLFMKGSPTVPRCGFSKQVIALLNSYDAKYETFDILEDFEVREALKSFSNWPTYPQLYVKAQIRLLIIQFHALEMLNIFRLKKFSAIIVCNLIVSCFVFM
ncbi:glutaredoxin-3 [Nephila pilipes]|uniref:Glutaredoxin-3 n=1 Tax=Nephila pilipes TaxID=299642 RepID=A0A8X6TTJ2_NEPPI|nr:glutaredoxin-3 [Nephila pilipes]